MSNFNDLLKIRFESKTYEYPEVTITNDKYVADEELTMSVDIIAAPKSYLGFFNGSRTLLVWSISRMHNPIQSGVAHTQNGATENTLVPLVTTTLGAHEPNFVFAFKDGKMKNTPGKLIVTSSGTATSHQVAPQGS